MVTCWALNPCVTGSNPVPRSTCHLLSFSVVSHVVLTRDPLMEPEDDKAKLLNAISWYYDVNLEAAQKKARQLNYTQKQDILWEFEDFLVSGAVHE